MMDINPEQRLGAQNFQDLKDHPFFENISWEEVYNK